MSPLKGPQLPLDLGVTELTTVELRTEKFSNIREYKGEKANSVEVC
jgi:hypothetical protein